MAKKIASVFRSPNKQTVIVQHVTIVNNVTYVLPSARPSNSSHYSRAPARSQYAPAPARSQYAPAPSRSGFARTYAKSPPYAPAPANPYARAPANPYTRAPSSNARIPGPQYALAPHPVSTLPASNNHYHAPVPSSQAVPSGQARQSNQYALLPLRSQGSGQYASLSLKPGSSSQGSGQYASLTLRPSSHSHAPGQSKQYVPLPINPGGPSRGSSQSNQYVPIPVNVRNSNQNINIPSNVPLPPPLTRSIPHNTYDRVSMPGSR